MLMFTHSTVQSSPAPLALEVLWLQKAQLSTLSRVSSTAYITLGPSALLEQVMVSSLDHAAWLACQMSLRFAAVAATVPTLAFMGKTCTSAAHAYTLNACMCYMRTLRMYCIISIIYSYPCSLTLLFHRTRYACMRNTGLNPLHGTVDYR